MKIKTYNKSLLQKNNVLNIHIYVNIVEIIYLDLIIHCNILIIHTFNVNIEFLPINHTV